jgi:hypothetical protein
MLEYTIATRVVVVLGLCTRKEEELIRPVRLHPHVARVCGRVGCTIGIMN